VIAPTHSRDVAKGLYVRKTLTHAWTFDVLRPLDVAELGPVAGPEAPRPVGTVTGAGESTAEYFQARCRGRAESRARNGARLGNLLAPLCALKNFDARRNWRAGRSQFAKAQADFFGEKVGTLSARLLADPSYQFQGRFDEWMLRAGSRRAFAQHPVLPEQVATLTLRSWRGPREFGSSMEAMADWTRGRWNSGGMDFASLISGTLKTPRRPVRVRARNFTLVAAESRCGFRPGQFER